MCGGGDGRGPHALAAAEERGAAGCHPARPRPSPVAPQPPPPPPLPPPPPPLARSLVPHHHPALLRSNVKEHTEEEVIEMLNGCVCCTVRNDLIDTLNKIVRNSSVMKKGGYKLDAVVIETTGMADPAPVAQTFFVDEEIQKYYRLDGIVTMVDAKHVEQHLDEEKPEGAENEAVEQVAFADRIILNKVDLVPDEADLQRVEGRIRAINGFAQIVRADHSAVDAGNVLNLGAFDLQRTLEMDPEFLNIDGEHVHDESVSSTGVDIAGDVDLDMFQDYMSTILKEQGNDMFRMKGVLSVEGVPDKFVYQGG